jgi:hypothetical protein
MRDEIHKVGAIGTDGRARVVMFCYATGGIGWEVHGENVTEVGDKVEEVFQWFAARGLAPGNGNALKKDR